MKKDISSLRNDYSGTHLDPKNVMPHPIDQFHVWFEEALDNNVPEPTAMTLATVNDHMPSARIVLLKGYDKRGFTFFTNYLSRKSKEIETNPKAALLFFWPQLHRQIRICGDLMKIDQTVSIDYFNSRPRTSQISASVSLQSSVVESRAVLENKFANFEKQYAEKEILCPPFWGGYLLKPTEFEFWQGQADRLHDRVQYIFREESKWEINRLAP